MLQPKNNSYFSGVLLSISTLSLFRFLYFLLAHLGAINTNDNNTLAPMLLVVAHGLATLTEAPHDDVNLNLFYRHRHR